MSQSNKIEYKKLTYEDLKAKVEDALFGKVPEGRQIKVWAITPDGLVPIEQTPEFDRAMKAEYKRMIDNGEL